MLPHIHTSSVGLTGAESDRSFSKINQVMNSYVQSKKRERTGKGGRVTKDVKDQLQMRHTWLRQINKEHQISPEI